MNKQTLAKIEDLCGLLETAWNQARNIEDDACDTNCEEDLHDLEQAIYDALCMAKDFIY